MADQNLLTIFLAVTTLAILIQMGIVAGLYFASLKISQQANRAAVEARKFVDPVNRMVNTLESASNQLVDFSATTQQNLRQWEHQFGDVLDRFRRKVV